MGDEFKDQFRAAKAARTTAKPTKEQLKALKAQKAAAVAAAQQQMAEKEDTKSMPPPPPRPASVAPPLQKKPPLAPSAAPAAIAPPGSYHPDSQGTRINDGGVGLLHSEPSVNKQTAPLLYPTNNNNNNNASLVDSSNALPTGFFEAPVATQGGQGSTGGVPNVDIVVSKAAKSGEGSTGAALGGGGGGGGMRSRGSGGDFLIATSQLSAMVETDPNAVAPAASNALGGRTSQQTTANKMNNTSIEGGGTSSKQQLPSGFFDASAAAVAPQGTKASVAAGKDVDMDKEFADFMKEVDVDAPEGAAEAEAAAVAVVEEEEDDEGARLAREDFEQFVRRERLREVKEQAAATTTTQYATALEEKPASALEIAGVVADDVLPAPKIVLPKKRKVAETVALLEKESQGDSDSDGSSGDDDGDGVGMVDWRAKKSVSRK